MSDVPSWLTEENVSLASNIASNPTIQKEVVKEVKKSNNPTPPPPPPVSNSPFVDVEAQTTRASSTAGAFEASQFGMDEVSYNKMKQMHLFLRILYMGAACFLSASAVLTIMSSNPKLGKLFFSGYVFFFSALICCFECAITQCSRLIAVNFGFMYTLTGRCVFLLLVGFMAFGLKLGIFSMCALYAVGLFHAFILYQYPKFEQYLRKKHYYEGKKSGN